MTDATLRFTIGDAVEFDTVVEARKEYPRRDVVKRKLRQTEYGIVVGLKRVVSGVLVWIGEDEGSYFEPDKDGSRLVYLVRQGMLNRPVWVDVVDMTQVIKAMIYIPMLYQGWYTENGKMKRARMSREGKKDYVRYPNDYHRDAKGRFF